MNKEEIAFKDRTELALQIMELSSENLILEQQCKKQRETIDKLELENKVLKEQMVAMVKPNYIYGIR